MAEIEHDKTVDASVSWFGLVLCVLMAGLAWKVTPTFEEMGLAALGSVVFFAVGLAIGMVEWITRGRFRLAALGLALAPSAQCQERWWVCSTCTPFWPSRRCWPTLRSTARRLLRATARPWETCRLG